MEELNQIRKLCASYEHTDFTYGTVYHVDNLHIMLELMLMPDFKFSLTVTDPPYNVNAKAKDQVRNKDDGEKKESYNDNLDANDYVLDMSHFYNEVMGVSDALILSPGHANVKMWCEFAEPSDYIFHNKGDGQGFSANTYAIKTELYLMYGRMINKRRLPTNTIYAKLNHHIRYGPHPHPKPPELYRKLIEPLQPAIVFDPYLGSGTTALVCEELGIPWVGCEISQTYIDECIIPRCNNAKQPMNKQDMIEL